MREKLEVNTLIWFDPARDGSFQHFIRVTGCIAEGGTGLIYTGVDDQGISWVVKESFPNSETGLLKRSGVLRRKDGNIISSSKEGTHDLLCDINRILENENEVALTLQNDFNNGIMSMPFYNGLLKGAALQRPSENKPTVCNQVFSRMQYIKGTTADQADFRCAAEKLTALRDILAAIAQIHHAGFILGDIKPQNIMIAEGRRCFVLDYGSAVRTAENGMAEIDPECYPHSSGYVAPEFFEMRKGNAYLTKAYDVYSLGALLLDLLMPERTGTLRKIQYRKDCYDSNGLKYQDLENYGVFSKLSIQKELPVSPALADQLSRILRKSLSDERTLRYADAGEMLKDYTLFLNNYQYETVPPKEYNYHLLWQASYDCLNERLKNTLSHKTDSIHADMIIRENTPKWWKLEPIKAYDADGQCYPDALSIWKALEKEDVYLYGDAGSGKTIKACQIMLSALRKMPVMYLDLKDLSQKNEEISLSINQLIRQTFCYSKLNVTDAFIEKLKEENERFLLVLDNSNHLSSFMRKRIIKIIGAMKEEFYGAEILLIGRNNTIDADAPDGYFHKIRLDVLEEEENALLQIPFFHTLYRKLKYQNPAFVLSAENEVRFLDQYMDAFGVDYYKYHVEEILMKIAAALINPYCHVRYIEKADLYLLLEEEFGYQEDQKKEDIVDILSWKLGLLVPVKEKASSLNDSRRRDYGSYRSEIIYEFSHDIYQDYFTAKYIASLMEKALSANSRKPLSDVLLCDWDHNVKKLLMELLNQDQLDRLYELFLNADEQDDADIGIIRLFAEYDWFLKNYTVTGWATLGADRKDSFCMAVCATDLIRRITVRDHSTLPQAIELCRRSLAAGDTGDWFYNRLTKDLSAALQVLKLCRRSLLAAGDTGDWIYNRWAKDYLGMLILHDALEKTNQKCYLDLKQLEGRITSGDLETNDPERYYRITSEIGKIDDLSLQDGWELLFEEGMPEGVVALLAEEGAEHEKPDPLTKKNDGTLRVRRKHWNVIRGMEPDDNIFRFHTDEGEIDLRFLTFVTYKKVDYEIYLTVDYKDTSGVEEVIIMKENSYEIIDGELMYQSEKVEDPEIIEAVFRIFMNEKESKEMYEII